MKSTTIRDSILAQVERCAYVERTDAQQHDGNCSPPMSYRKHQWLQQKANWRVDSASILPHHSATHEQEQRSVVASAIATQDALRVQQQALELQRTTAAAAVDAARVRQQADFVRLHALEAAALANASERGGSVPLAFDAFLDEIHASDICVRCSQSPLPATPFDRLGAISMPSKREGNSLTLCCWHDDAYTDAVTASPSDEQYNSGDGKNRSQSETQQLVVFGGRVLQDVAMLLPAAVRKDPMQLERVRYTYSNGVYAYDIATSVWRFRECNGRAPRERSDHTAVFLKPHYLVIVGGRGRNGHLFSDVCVLDLVAWHWTLVDTDARVLEQRYWHACCVLNASVFVFGGKSDVCTHGDLLQLSAAALLDVLALSSSKPQAGTTVPAQASSTTPRSTHSLLSWVCPNTVGKAPSPRFGMALLALDHDRVAVVGGYRPNRMQHARVEQQRPPRLMDVHILDTVTMIWSTPRLSTHVSTALTAPTERMLFECFYYRSSVIVFGGFTYATNGETESFTSRQDDAHAVYTLDISRMIWRCQNLSTDVGVGDTVPQWLPSAHVHASANNVLGDRAFTCTGSNEHSLLELAAFDLQRIQDSCCR